MNERSTLGGYNEEDDFFQMKVYVEDEIWSNTMSRGMIPFSLIDWGLIDDWRGILQSTSDDVLMNEAFANILKYEYCDWHLVLETYIQIANSFLISPAVSRELEKDITMAILDVQKYLESTDPMDQINFDSIITEKKCKRADREYFEYYQTGLDEFGTLWVFFGATSFISSVSFVAMLIKNQRKKATNENIFSGLTALSHKRTTSDIAEISSFYVDTNASMSGFIYFPMMKQRLKVLQKFLSKTVGRENLLGFLFNVEVELDKFLNAEVPPNRRLKKHNFDVKKTEEWRNETHKPLYFSPETMSPKTRRADFSARHKRTKRRNGFRSVIFNHSNTYLDFISGSESALKKSIKSQNDMKKMKSFFLYEYVKETSSLLFLMSGLSKKSYESKLKKNVNGCGVNINTEIQIPLNNKRRLLVSMEYYRKNIMSQVKRQSVIFEEIFRGDLFFMRKLRRFGSIWRKIYKKKNEVNENLEQFSENLMKMLRIGLGYSLMNKVKMARKSSEQSKKGNNTISIFKLKHFPKGHLTNLVPTNKERNENAMPRRMSRQKEHIPDLCESELMSPNANLVKEFPDISNFLRDSRDRREFPSNLFDENEQIKEL